MAYNGKPGYLDDYQDDFLLLQGVHNEFLVQLKTHRYAVTFMHCVSCIHT